MPFDRSLDMAMYHGNGGLAEAMYYYGHTDKPVWNGKIPDFEIVHNGTGNAAVKVILQEGDEIVTNAGAMCYSDGNAQFATQFSRGGVFAMIKRMMAGASAQQNTYRCNPCPGWVVLNAPGAFGDIVSLELLPGETWNGVMNGFIASTPNIEVKMSFNIKMQFTSTGGKPVKYTNVGQTPGRIWVKAFGGVTEIILKSGELLKVDQGCFVMANQEATLSRSGSGLKAMFMGGEGLLYKFQGPTTVYVQSVERTPIR